MTQSATTLTTEKVLIDWDAERWELHVDGQPFAHHAHGATTTPDGTHPALFGESLPSIALQLAFPATLPLWGRGDEAWDDSRLIYMEPLSDIEILLTFEHLRAPSQRSTLIWHRQLRMLIELTRWQTLCRVEIDSVNATE